MAYRIGSDVGGTFTDVVVIGPDGALHVQKALTTPDDRTAGMVDAVRVVAGELDVEPDEFMGEVGYFAHGTTAATNAFLERRGARTALLTTRGFGDILRLQRSMASWTGLSVDDASHYSRRSIPVPIVDMDDVGEIDERVDYAGSVVVPLITLPARTRNRM